MALTRKLVYIFIFTTNHFRVSDTQRERERERERELPIAQTNRNPAMAPPTPQNHRQHLDRTTTEIAPQTDRTHQDHITTEG